MIASKRKSFAERIKRNVRTGNRVYWLNENFIVTKQGSKYVILNYYDEVVSPLVKNGELHPDLHDYDFMF